MSLFDRLFRGNKGSGKSRGKNTGLRAVPGALSYSQEGKVVYNLLDPVMSQFLGRCIGAIKKAGMKAKGTGHFSVSLGDGNAELPLDAFYRDFCDKVADPASVIQKVVSAVQSAVDKTE